MIEHWVQIYSNQKEIYYISPSIIRASVETRSSKLHYLLKFSPSFHPRHFMDLLHWIDGWMVGGWGGVRTTKMLILLSLKIHEFIFKFLPLDNCLPRCRIPSCHFRVVASTLSLPSCRKRERTWQPCSRS